LCQKNTVGFSIILYVFSSGEVNLAE